MGSWGKFPVLFGAVAVAFLKEKMDVKTSKFFVAAYAFFLRYSLVVVFVGCCG